MNANADRKSRILAGIYNSSWGTSMVTQAIVAILEIFMLVYTLVNPSLFGQYMGIYRKFYISLLTAAVAYMTLNVYIKRDIERRHMWLSVANPLYAAFYFAWALGITYFDAVKYGAADPAVFMTFSLTVPLSFFLFPSVYLVIVAVADGIIFYIMTMVSASIGPMINLSIFIIFQLVLGISFLRLKMKLAERIVKEHENAEIDVLTGFPNRRAYIDDITKLSEGQAREGLIYLAIDMNELKEVNDSRGHEAGDRLIIGAAECISRCFGAAGKMYRIGGDEFAVIVTAGSGEMDGLIERYNRNMAAWSEQNGLALTTALGYACWSEHPQADINELARIADQKMYEAKAEYYRKSGRDRRRYGDGQ